MRRKAGLLKHTAALLKQHFGARGQFERAAPVRRSHLGAGGAGRRGGAAVCASGGGKRWIEKGERRVWRSEVGRLLRPRGRESRAPFSPPKGAHLRMVCILLVLVCVCVRAVARAGSGKVGAERGAARARSLLGERGRREGKRGRRRTTPAIAFRRTRPSPASAARRKRRPRDTSTRPSQPVSWASTAIISTSRARRGISAARRRRRRRRRQRRRRRRRRGRSKQAIDDGR